MRSEVESEKEEEERQTDGERGAAAAVGGAEPGQRCDGVVAGSIA